MKKLKAKILKARSFLSIRTYKHPMMFVISLMILLNIIILCIAALIALSLDSGFTNFIDAFANGSLKWMLTPNAILQIENPETLFLAVVVLVIGMILFTGTIIALTTNAIKDYFQKKKSGSGKIYIEDHIVILNWNNKVPELVADLIHVENKEVKVVILAEIDKDFAEKQMLNAIHKEKKNDQELKHINILIKNGNPLLLSDLYDISIENCSAILIMNKDSHQLIIEGMSKSDLNVIKVILSLGRIEFTKEPPIVAEIKRIETKQKILTMSDVVETIHEHTILPICFDRRLGQIIAQTIIDSQMEDVYLSLFSFEDSEVYFLENCPFDDCLKYRPHVIPMTKHKQGCFVLAENEQATKVTINKAVDIVDLTLNLVHKPCDMDVYIIGANNKLSFIMSSFSEYESLYQSKFKAQYIQEDHIAEMVETLNQSTQPATIVLLSDELQESDSLDANVIDHLIFLQSQLQKKDINIIVELLDPSNDHIVKDFNIENTIISNKIISLLLSKLALYKETAPFYENLLTIKSDITGKDDQNIFIYKTKDVMQETLPITFEDVRSFIISFYKASKEKYIPIGVFEDHQLKIFSAFAHKDMTFKIDGDEDLVVMKI